MRGRTATDSPSPRATRLARQTAAARSRARHPASDPRELRQVSRFASRSRSSDVLVATLPRSAALPAPACLLARRLVLSDRPGSTPHANRSSPAERSRWRAPVTPWPAARPRRQLAESPAPAALADSTIGVAPRPTAHPDRRRSRRLTRWRGRSRPRSLPQPVGPTPSPISVRRIRQSADRSSAIRPTPCVGPRRSVERPSMCAAPCAAVRRRVVLASARQQRFLRPRLESSDPRLRSSPHLHQR